MTGEGEVCQKVGNYSSSGFNYGLRITRDLKFLQRYGCRLFAYHVANLLFLVTGNQIDVPVALNLFVDEKST